MLKAEYANFSIYVLLYVTKHVFLLYLINTFGYEKYENAITVQSLFTTSLYNNILFKGDKFISPAQFIMFYPSPPRHLLTANNDMEKCS